MAGAAAASGGVLPFFPPARPSGSVVVKLCPTENVPIGQLVLVTFGIPWPRGSLAGDGLATLRVLRGSDEVPAFVDQLTPWRSLTDAQADGKWVRVARLQFRYAFTVSFPASEEVTVEWGLTRRQKTVASSENPRNGWHLVTAGSFSSADKLYEPDVYALLPKDLLADGTLYGSRLDPFDASVTENRSDPAAMAAVQHWPGYIEQQHAAKNSFYTLINEDDPRVTAANECPYETDYDPWLYDRAAAMFALYMRSGFFRPLREAVRQAQFYKNNLYPSGATPANAVGIFRLKIPDPAAGIGGGNGAMYSYGESLAYTYWLTGDADMLEPLRWVVSAHDLNDEPTRWSPGLPGWTERHTAFRLLANTMAYEVLGDSGYRDAVRSISQDFIWHQNGADGQLPANRVDGGLYHYGWQHGDGTPDQLLASPWMSALTQNAMVRAYGVTEDRQIADFIRRLGTFFKAACKADKYNEFDYGTVLTYCDYMTRVNGQSDVRNDNDTDHALETSAAVAWAGYFSALAGSLDPLLGATAGELYYTYDIGVNYWIRPTGPASGLPAFRVSPWRKYGWEHRPSGSLSWLMKQLRPAWVADGGIVDAASYRNMPLAPGSIVALFGGNLSGSTRSVDNLPLPTTISVVTVYFNGQPAPQFFGSASQINLQVPWELQGQSQAAITLTSGDAPTAPVTVKLAEYAPGLFSIDASGKGQGAILISATGELAARKGSVAGRAARPVARGGYVSIYCTGLGRVKSPPKTGAAAPRSPLSPTLVTPDVSIGTVPAQVTFAGLAPGYAGLYQVDVQVPMQAPSGDFIPVVMGINGAYSNTVTIAVE